ncbi:hypothetical protein KCP73_20150 [Salmonella enterica subsp. enterica]|nr:hypothetical protein KCP73_20150 [Salmonella enterica subsp. enterica]
MQKARKITDAVEKFSVIKTLQAIEDANVVLLVIDARAGSPTQICPQGLLSSHSGRSPLS